MAQETFVVEKPTVHLLHMVVFTLIVAVIAAVLFPHIKDAFMANPGLNGLIIGALLFGTLYAYLMVARLFPEVNWLNGFRLGQGSSEAPPTLLSPLATMLSDASGRTVLSPQTMRSLLDSLASRLDESRDLLRYLVALLIFLGLLGTFWGLLATVTSVGDAIKGLDVSSAQSANVFNELKSGLQKPLAGMGLSFSSSLFGLASSLILGFLDLKAAQAQNRFYHNLEDWLSTITDVHAGEGGGTMMPAFLRIDLQNLQKSIDRLGTQFDGRPGVPAPTVNGGTESATEDLADAVANLVQQMREEQKMVRQWIQSQQVQQSEIQRLLMRGERK
jgi:hypothetical protein